MSAKLNQNTGDVLIAEPKAEPEAPRANSIRPTYDEEVHCGEGLMRAPKPGEWPVALQSPDGRVRLGGEIADLSARGCTVVTDKAFPGELKDTLEVKFELLSLRFVLIGAVVAVYDPQIIGIQFAPIGARKREEFAEAIADVCAANRTRLQVG